MRYVLLCLLVSSAALPPTVNADPITIFVDGRHATSVSLVRDNAGEDRERREVVPVQGTATTEVSSPQGHFATAVARVFSDVSDPRLMSGAGSGSVTAIVPPINTIGLSETVSVSQFNLFFFLDSPHRFDFSAYFTGTGSSNDPQAFSGRSWTASLIAMSAARTVNVFEHRRSLAVGSNKVRATGLLQPSEYQIFVEQVLNQEIHQPRAISSEGGFAFIFELTPAAVPEPASFVLLGSGLAAMAVRRWRHRTASAS